MNKRGVKGKMGRKPKNAAGPVYSLSAVAEEIMRDADMALSDAGVSRETIVVERMKPVYEYSMDDPLIVLVKRAIESQDNPALVRGILCDLQNMLARKGVL